MLLSLRGWSVVTGRATGSAMDSDDEWLSELLAGPSTTDDSSAWLQELVNSAKAGFGPSSLATYEKKN